MEESEEIIEKLTQEIAKGGSIALTGKAINKIIGFPIKILMARFLGASNLGLISLSTNLLGWFNLFSKVGLNEAAIKFLPNQQRKENNKRLKGTLLSVLFIPTTIAALFAFGLFLSSGLIASLFNKPEIKSILEVISVSLPFSILTTMSVFSLRGLKRIGYSKGLNLLKTVFYLTILTIAFGAGLKLYGAIGAIIISAVLSSITGLLLVWRVVPDLFSSLSPSINLRKLLEYSVPLYFSGFVYKITRRVDMIMLGFFLASSEIGIYSVAVSLVVMISFPLDSINYVFAPIISDLFDRENIYELASLYKMATRWTYILTIPIFLIFFLFSKDILLQLYGARFAEGWLVLSILAFLELGNPYFGAVGYILKMTDNQQWVLYINGFSSVLNIGLNLILIPKFGILGAGIASGLSVLTNNLIQFLIMYKKVKIHPWNHNFLRLIPTILLSFLTYFILEKAGIHWAINMISVGLVYLIGLYSIGITNNDKKVIYAFWNKIRARV